LTLKNTMAKCLDQ